MSKGSARLLSALVVIVFGAGLGLAPTAGNVQAQGTDVYLVLMDANPVASYRGNVDGFEQTRPQLGERLDPQSPDVRSYVHYLGQEHGRALAGAGVSDSGVIHQYYYSLNGFAVRMSSGQAELMGKQPGVIYVREDELKHVDTENSPGFLGLSAPGGAWSQGILGEDVVVGVIDTGIWPEHPSFEDDGSYSAPPIAIGECNFGNTAFNPADASFACNNKLIGARQVMDTYKLISGLTPSEYDSARDDNGHGTHTASTAAGNGGVQAAIFGIDRGTVSGMAPRARVVSYKACGVEGCYTSDLAAAIDIAVLDGVDVINYSIGGGASLIGADDIAFLFAADAGVFAATSAGNDGPGAGTVGGPGTVPWITTVGASTQNRTFEGTVVLGDATEFTGASITEGTGMLPLVDSEDLGNELCIPGDGFDEDVTGKIVLCRRGVIARIDKSRAVFEAGGAGTILYNTNDTEALITDNHWTPAVHVNNTTGQAIKSYIDSSGRGGSATAQIVGGVFTTIDAPWMADFSSRGPNSVAGDIIKPDVTAPGVNILAGNSATPELGPPGELFQVISGTSMSSPHVAGVFALLKEAHPDWSPAMAKSALMTSAYQDVKEEDGSTPADPFDMGAGHISPGPRSARAGGTLDGTAFDPGLVYDAGFFEYLGFLCDAEPEAFSDPAGTCAFLESLGVPTDASDLNLGSIGIAELPGSQTVTRIVTAVDGAGSSRGGGASATTYRVRVDQPPGFKVEVSPTSLTLKPGESASYEVTFTNRNAPIGAWRFGSLSWGGGGHTVYSPIAVRASQFDAAYEVSGSGMEGTADFEIKFGYTGDYSAAAHGLVPATITTDNVVQDPDQSFDPNDGFSNMHQFNLSGAALLRIALPPDSTEVGADLDVYVFDPNGNFAAASTSAGTNELIDVPFPMDGVWTVFVHGWLTPGGDSDYDMSSWVVSATPGGSLSVDVAPASATLGVIETIQVSWSGLAAGEEYLGAVSHSDGGGFIGLTLVSVDT